MKKALVGFLLLTFAVTAQMSAAAQQIPFLSDLLTRYETFNRLYTQKRRAGVNLSAIEPLRKRGEEAFKRGDIPAILEAIGEAETLLAGRKWDEHQKFIASLTLEVDRLVIEPNQVLQVSLTRIFPANLDKAFTSAPTVTFMIVSGQAAAGTADVRAAKPLPEPLVIAQRLTIAETSSNATRRLLLPDGAYEVVAVIETAGQKIVEIRRPVYAISDFSETVAQMFRTVAGIKSASDAKTVALASLVSTPEFQLQRLAQLNKTRGEVSLNPNEEIDRIEAELSALTMGKNPFDGERGEIERAYQTADGMLVPYRVYVPKSYDGASSKPLVVILHGALGDERYYFSGLVDAEIIKSEAERRGYILTAVNGRGRFSNYTGASQQDVFDVTGTVIRDYKIDPSRIFLTGHSMGGFGTWLVASSKPELFAAVAAVSGGPPAQGDALTSLLNKLKAVPAMIVHGAQDGIVPVQLSRNMAAAAGKAGVKVTYLEVPDGDHLSVVASTFPAILDFFDKNAKPGAK
jgi:pimeloyl-ACP methyl ester carboxylesterase